MSHNLVYMGYIWALFMELFQKMYFVFFLFFREQIILGFFFRGGSFGTN